MPSLTCVGEPQIDAPIEDVQVEVPSAGGSSASVASPVSPSAERDIHLHCENCINVATCHNSTCPIVLCDCGHKLHHCKLEDHALLCRKDDINEPVVSSIGEAPPAIFWLLAQSTHATAPSSPEIHLFNGKFWFLQSTNAIWFGDVDAYTSALVQAAEQGAQKHGQLGANNKIC
ncbi:hypothetical protein BIW11_13016 [Tropilaelaps mercedesae]|uniref:TRAF-type domain-containing protein n=1 Tax=Tropilaelaps mercedesae TaxID=418985 RepID=A0A1V9X4S3_9ACAR|nr:hypothetical protein BIW11_13016 [Tropilaelaps mercedesae]